METRPPKILLTGPPGCGKTTLIRKIVQLLEVPARGFYTEEVRGAGGRRTGFDVITLDGRRGRLSEAGFPGPRVGRYGVDLQFLENVALSRIEPAPGILIVIDEIGKMECFSRRFVETVGNVLAGSSAVLGTVARGGSPFIREVRKREDVTVVEVTVGNRDDLVEEVIDKLRIENLNCGHGSESSILNP